MIVGPALFGTICGPVPATMANFVGQPATEETEIETEIRFETEQRSRRDEFAASQRIGQAGTSADHREGALVRREIEASGRIFRAATHLVGSGIQLVR